MPQVKPLFLHQTPIYLLLVREITQFIVTLQHRFLKIDKPFVLVEGYDTKNNNSAINTFGYISSILSNQLGIQLLSQGYDIIVLNFADNGDYI